MLKGSSPEATLSPFRARSAHDPDPYCGHSSPREPAPFSELPSPNPQSSEPDPSTRLGCAPHLPRWPMHAELRVPRPSFLAHALTLTMSRVNRAGPSRPRPARERPLGGSPGRQDPEWKGRMRSVLKCPTGRRRARRCVRHTSSTGRRTHRPLRTFCCRVSNRGANWVPHSHGAAEFAPAAYKLDRPRTRGASNTPSFRWSRPATRSPGPCPARPYICFDSFYP